MLFSAATVPPSQLVFLIRFKKDNKDQIFRNKFNAFLTENFANYSTTGHYFFFENSAKHLPQRRPLVPFLAGYAAPFGPVVPIAPSMAESHARLAGQTAGRGVPCRAWPGRAAAPHPPNLLSLSASLHVWSPARPARGPASRSSHVDSWALSGSCAKARCASPRAAPRSTAPSEHPAAPPFPVTPFGLKTLLARPTRAGTVAKSKGKQL